MPETGAGYVPPSAAEPADARVNQLLGYSWAEEGGGIESATEEVVEKASGKLGVPLSGQWERLLDSGLQARAKKEAPQLVLRRTLDLDGRGLELYFLVSRGKITAQDKYWDASLRGKVGRTDYFVPWSGWGQEEMEALARVQGRWEAVMRASKDPQAEEEAEERAHRAEERYKKARQERIVAGWEGKNLALFKPN